MGQVEDADGHQEKARAAVDLLAEGEIDVGLLEFDLAVLAVAGDGVLELELGYERDAVGEIVIEVKDEPMEIKFLLAVEVVVMQLAIAADAGPVGPAVAARRVAVAHLLEHIADDLDFLVGRLCLVAGARQLGLKLFDLPLLLLDDAPHFLGIGGVGRTGRKDNHQPGQESQTALRVEFHRVAPLVLLVAMSLIRRMGQFYRIRTRMTMILI